MKLEFIRCKFCRTDIPSELCQLTTHSMETGEKKLVFCCARHAQEYIQRETESEGTS